MPCWCPAAYFAKYAEVSALVRFRWFVWTADEECWPPLDRRQGCGRNLPLLPAAAGLNGSVYVYDQRTSRLRMRDSRGRWTTVASRGAELGQVGSPAGIATDAIGRVYVADYSNQRVQVRDADGKWFVLAAADAEAPVKPRYSLNIAVDRHGVVYVPCGWPTRIICWTPQPKPQAATGVSGRPGPPKFGGAMGL